MSKRTTVAALTSVGRGAIAVVRVEGPKALTAIDACFVPARGKLISQTAENRIRFGTWRGDATDGKVDVQAGEELVVCRTGKQAAEVHCHGGEAAVAAVVASLVSHGCQRIGVLEWLPDGNDRIAAEAREALARCVTERAAAVLLDQLNGSLENEVRAILAEVDQQASPIARINLLLSRAEFGKHLTKPWRVVIAGAPNVGKSSLANAILGYERAIVFDQPGTTRDVVTATTAVDGWPIALSDTAGLRDSEDDIERAGVALAEQQLAQADLVLHVTVAGEVDDEELAPVGATRLIKVANKTDLTPLTEGDDRLGVSAKTGAGLGQLIAAISDALVPEPPPAGAAVPFTHRQVDCLMKAREGETTQTLLTLL